MYLHWVVKVYCVLIFLSTNVILHLYFFGSSSKVSKKASKFENNLSWTNCNFVQILVVTEYHTVEGEHLNCFIGGLVNKLFQTKNLILN